MSDFAVDEARPWLGGFKEGIHGDEATYFPDLWTWFVKEKGVQSVIDVGCGSGVSVKFFQSLLGKKVIGIEGIKQDHNLSIIQHDYTTGPWVPDLGLLWFDLCWCCETVEHLEEKYLPNLLDTFRRARMIAMTHAEPGQQGYHHVNCQTSDYWKGALAAIGYRFDQMLTTQARLMSSLNASPWNHFHRAGLVFVRN